MILEDHDWGWIFMNNKENARGVINNKGHEVLSTTSHTRVIVRGETGYNTLTRQQRTWSLDR